MQPLMRYVNQASLVNTHKISEKEKQDLGLMILNIFYLCNK